MLQKADRKYMFYNLKMKESFSLFTFLLLATCTLQAIIFTDSLPSIIKVSSSQYIISTEPVSSKNPSNSKVGTSSSGNNQFHNILSSLNLQQLPVKPVTSGKTTSTGSTVQSTVFYQTSQPQALVDPYTKPIAPASYPLIIGGGVANPTVTATHIISPSPNSQSVGLSYIPPTKTHIAFNTVDPSPNSQSVGLSYMPPTKTLTAIHTVDPSPNSQSVGLSYIPPTKTLTAIHTVDPSPNSQTVGLSYMPPTKTLSAIGGGVYNPTVSTQSSVHSTAFNEPKIMVEPYTKAIAPTSQPLLIIGGGVANMVSAQQIVSYSPSTPSIGLSYMPPTQTLTYTSPSVSVTGMSNHNSYK